MKIIIQCAGTKSDCATKLKNTSGDEIIFVADPYKVKDKIQGISYQRPDDLIPSQNKTWREFLVEYNFKNTNPLNLAQIADLYKPKIYGDLVNHFGCENVFILSAGWGLVRSDYLLTYYDITFSNLGKPGIKRIKSQIFYDFNHLPRNLDITETIHFFGGSSYLPLFYSLTTEINAKNIIHYAQEYIQKFSGFQYVKYKDCFTNWQYKCAEDFIFENSILTKRKNSLN